MEVVSLLVDIGAFVAPLVGGILSAVCTGVGVYVAISNRLAIVETKLDILDEKQDKHNNLIERMALVEQDDKAQWRRIDEVRGEMETIRRELQ